MIKLSPADRLLIIPELTATNKKEVLNELATAAGQLCDLDLEGLQSSLEAREELGSTAIGNGVAIPHARLEGLDRIILVCGRSLKGIHFGARDNHPVQLFLLFLTPSSATCPYLGYLAELVRFLRNPATKSRLLKAENQAQLAAVLGGLLET